MSHPIFARFFASVAAPALTKAGVTRYRRRLVEGLSGEVIEIGAGNGLNFPHYPPEVSRVLAVEPEPRLRAAAGQAALDAPVPVDVVGGLAERIPAEDGRFDAAVACLTLCSVTDQAAALGELYRVLRPGGRLCFFEHVRAGTPGMRRVQRVLDATIWPPLMGGCHTGRDTEAAIEAAGFRLEELEEFDFPETKVPAPAVAHILGTAIRP
ncbi:class I SAM-dependent methyltransferase [Streptomyces smaragdinus]|nr:class I SAM-dependent methyltransferase [Streptomyces smaragdinus]